MSQELANVVQKPVLALLGKYKRQIESILPQQLTPERVLKLIVGEINRNPRLLECTPWSVVNAVLTASSMGLEIRPQSAYLVPFSDPKKNRVLCTLLIDYRGKIDLVTRNGKVVDVDAEIVYAKEKFRVFRNEFGFKVLEHEPIFYVDDEKGRRPVTEADRGVPLGAYAIASMLAGERPKFTFMPAVEIEKIRLRAPSGKDANSAWGTNPMEMWKKTAIHRLCKTLPQTPELAKSQDVDDRAEIGVSLDDVIDVSSEDSEDVKPILPASQQAQDAVAEKRIADLRAEEARLVAEKKAGGLTKASDILGGQQSDEPQKGGQPEPTKTAEPSPPVAEVVEDEPEQPEAKEPTEQEMRDALSEKLRKEQEEAARPKFGDKPAAAGFGRRK